MMPVSLIAPLESARATSPRSLPCSRLSTTTRSARARREASSSCFSGVSEPTAVMCVPGLTQSASIRGSVAEVQVMMTRHESAREGTSAAASTSTPRPANCSLKRSTRSGVLPQTSALVHPRAREACSSCNAAWTPVPTIPRTSTSLGARVREARAPAAAVRTSVR